MSPIENLTLTCEKDEPFSEGDTVTGTVSFTLTKDTKVKSVSLQAKGKADVKWKQGNTHYHGYRGYFKDKEYLVAKNPKVWSMPSSFKENSQSIVYMLKAKITRKWHWSSSVQKEIDFVSRSILNISRIMCPQSGSVTKKVSKGEVQMSASVNRKVCSPGDTLSAFAKICNSSSKSMRPKFTLQQKIEYHVKKSTKTKLKTLFKSVGDTIEPNTEVTASCKMEIPTSTIYTINNCDIISVEYYFKVYLDISFAFDPEVVFPLIVIPSSASHPCEEVEPCPSCAFGGLRLQ
ncbi:arrestin domain-containing protein 3-like [Nematolebias whitei]|uniref:arrestin domain-containing protein 3-like n=1 Tax=Nematolebias whitei TaxID=451745 RepID=UPI00189BD200|nr:arrestin domain-containing protein 3-like [Nematolebias whitei]